MGRVRQESIEADLTERARRWAERTCREQGLPVKITDAMTVAKVAAVLREVSDSPDGFQSLRVETV